MRAFVIAAALAGTLPGAAAAQEADKTFRLSAPAALVESGLLDHILPRFSLKTATRVRRVPEGAEAEAAFGSEGRAVFEGPAQTWHLALAGEDPDAAAFADWLSSATGRAAVAGYGTGGEAPFGPAARKRKQEKAEVLEGDAARGEALALRHCGRCHVVNEANRMKAIGSTPSFAVLRTFPDWTDRMRGFFALNPHPAFTRIEDVTPPFPASRPPPIAPVEMTLDELEDVLVYMQGIAPADLGAPVMAR